MMEWLSSICQLFGTQPPAVVAILCIAHAVLLIGLIVLGFGPLRAWLGPAAPRRSPGGQPVAREEGLIATWRLYQRLGRARPSRG